MEPTSRPLTIREMFDCLKSSLRPLDAGAITSLISASFLDENLTLPKRGPNRTIVAEQPDGRPLNTQKREQA